MNIDKKEQACNVDYSLQSLVHMIDNTECEVDITLSVSGAIVCGRLCSGKKFFSNLGSKFSSAFHFCDKLYIDEMATMSKMAGELFYSKERETEDTMFIHLKDAYFITNQTGNNHKGKMLWRGKINDVNSFSIGLSF